MGFVLAVIVGAILWFLVGHPKGHRLTGTILGPAVALLSSLLGGKSAADGGKCKARKLATQKTTETPTGPEPSEASLQQMLEKLNKSGKAALKSMEHAQRGALLRKCVDSIMSVSEELVTDTLKFKGSYEPGSGEETLCWGASACVARQLAETFETLERTGGNFPNPVSVDKNGDREVVTVFPQGFYECGLFPGYNGEIWFPPGVKAQRESPWENEPRTFFMLGAGNQATVIGCDVLNIIFREHAVCICKLNPVNDYINPHMQKAFKPLIDAGLLYIVNGGRSVSEYLINHDLVDAVHMTGSDKTYDAIVWGPGAKKEGKPKMNKTFTAELGCCTPYIITPGQWDDKAIDLHARQIVGATVHNAHFNCVSTQLIITHSKWPQRDQFLKAFGRHLKAAQPRTAYYPGAASRHKAFLEEYKNNISVQSEEAEGAVPWTLITGVKPAGYSCQNEAFAGVVTEMTLDSGSTTDFLKEATTLCNDKIWGTLSCSIFIPPDTYKAFNDQCEQAIRDLKYGSVVINVPSILGYFVTKCSWGGYRGHTREDVQSGIGNIHNCLMYKDVEKSVIRGPWTQVITPFWCHDHANCEALAPWIVKQLANESLINWTMCAIHAVQG
jgi:acyl-CoA reductase-like NAD-dependent aldehyde dehydrogenase